MAMRLNMLYHDVTNGNHLGSKSELEALLRHCEQVQQGFAALHYPEAEVDARVIGGHRVVTAVTIPPGVSVASLRQRFAAAWQDAPQAAKVGFYREFLFGG